ncbi:hypothetical protein AB0L04_08260 [Streptomyces glaucescens]|uniref:hypothetical protein n=1 Tax=Streptomyces glaucescens TaxID=1907 RepID=UPI00344D2808
MAVPKDAVWERDPYTAAEHDLLKPDPGEQPGRLRPTGGPGIHDRMMEPWHRHILRHPGPPPPDT